ncbi:MAG: NAD(+) synthase [Tissierellia bacterium]|nr:NAD(+) synthase [Tissierellia bacterium]
MKLSEKQLENIALGMIDWIRQNMNKIGAKKAVIGISGGKDSTVTAALSAKAIGCENVYGLILPAKEQEDLSDAIEICNSLKINYNIINIGDMVENLKSSIIGTGISVSRQTEINIPPRIRMTALYAYAQSLSDALVVNTSNLSEDWIGYATVYGDTAGAFSPMATLTSDEVIQVGRYLGVADRFLEKPPADGLTGKTDEEVFGFSYDILNKYLRTGNIDDQEIKDKIDSMHRSSRFKFIPIPIYNSGLKICPDDIAEVYKFEDDDKR